jgi:hypothetical protein
MDGRTDGRTDGWIWSIESYMVENCLLQSMKKLMSTAFILCIDNQEKETRKFILSVVILIMRPSVTSLTVMRTTVSTNLWTRL